MRWEQKNEASEKEKMRVAVSYKRRCREVRAQEDTKKEAVT